VVSEVLVVGSEFGGGAAEGGGGWRGGKRRKQEADRAARGGRHATRDWRFDFEHVRDTSAFY
jgi:hypothetical protein